MYQTIKFMYAYKFLFCKNRNVKYLAIRSIRKHRLQLAIMYYTLAI
jgi:hypothetical protein